jgi:hypothetical protein
MADFSAMPDTLPSTSGGLDGFLKANPDTKPPSPKGPMGTAELRKHVDEAVTKLKDFETERKNTLIPETPKMTEGPKLDDYQTDPMKKFGSAASMLAVLGSLMTRHKFTNALNSAAEVNNAINTNDEKAYKTAYDKWKVDTENAWKMADWQQKLYEDKLQKIDAGERGAEAEFRMIAVATGDPSMDQAIKVNQYRNLILDRQKKLLEGREALEDYDMKHNFFQGRLEDAAAKKGSNLTPAESAEVRLAAKKEYEAKQRPGSDILKDEKERLTLVDSKKAGDAAAADVAKKGGSKEDQDAARNHAEEETIGKTSTLLAGKDTGDLSDEDYAKMTADPMVIGLSKSYRNGVPINQLVPGLSSHNKLRQAVIKKAYDDDPDFDYTSANRKYVAALSESRSVGTMAAKIKLGGNLLEKSIPPMLKAAEDVGLSESTDLNVVYNSVKRHLSDKDFAKFSTLLRATTSDYAVFLGRVSVSVHSDEEALKILHDNMGVTSLKGFSDAVDVERMTTLEGINDTIDGLGFTKGSGVPPEAIAHLKGDKDPDAESNFDAIFGKGAAKKALGK